MILFSVKVRARYVLCNIISNCTVIQVFSQMLFIYEFTALMLKIQNFWNISFLTLTLSKKESSQTRRYDKNTVPLPISLCGSLGRYSVTFCN